MGGKDSKLAYLPHDEAVKRVTDTELKRLKDAFKRSSTISGYMTKHVFVREVLGDGVPLKLGEQIFYTFGGSSKGLTFKELLCGLVLITRGRNEEKNRFVFGLYGDETYSYVEKQDMDASVLATEGCVPQALSMLFSQADKVGYGDFRTWLIHNVDTLSVSRWLLRGQCSVTLSNDLETPTFYQTLAGVTHLEESDFIELEKRYWTLKSQSTTGKFDLPTFQKIVCPPFPESIAQGLFSAFDENRDNHIDFKEMACGISACCRGPLIERQKFCFKIFDLDCDALLSRDELLHMINIMLAVREENNSEEEMAVDGVGEVTPSELADHILGNHASSHEDLLTQSEYLVWTVSHPLPAHFLHVLFQVCHVVLGLKAQNKEDEAKIVLGWLERSERLGLRVAQAWYLVAMPWWSQWLDYVTHTSSGSVARDAYKPKNNSIGTSLCPNLGRKYSSSSIASDDSEKVMKVTYSTLQPGDTRRALQSVSLSNSPTKYATVPRISNSVQSSPLRSNHSASDVANNGVVSRKNTYVKGANDHASSSVSPYVKGANSRVSPSVSPYVSKRMAASLPTKPGAIDNTSLTINNSARISTLTNEGGRLRKDRMLTRGRDFELVPEALWKSLVAWYGGAPPLPRTVIRMRATNEPEVELYPFYVKLYRHQTQQQQQRQTQMTSFSGMMGGIGGVVVGSSGMNSSQPQTPRRYWAYTACFSRKHTVTQVYEFISTRLRICRDDLRIWLLPDEVNMQLLDDDPTTVEVLGIKENDSMLIEVRNKDLTWPEELSLMAKNKAVLEKGPTIRGATGLSNLGNTCFMNSAVQCVSNTQVLTLYFTGGMHLYELNRSNPLGMKGHVAQRYGDLVKDLWSGTNRSLAPLKLRWTIGKYASRFNGFQQHDCQELLSFLLDGLHEDLNRVHVKPYVELKDSDGRADEIVAKEAWENHLQRNKSIIVDLFHGQLKSHVACKQCAHSSVRFDPFTYLSLPLPMDSCMHVEITVTKLDGSTPIKYGVRLNPDDKYRELKKQLSEMSHIDTSQLLLVEVFSALIKSFPQDNEKVKVIVLGSLYCYQVPDPPPIPTMSAEEEKGYTTPRENVNAGDSPTPVYNNNNGSPRQNVAHNNNNTMSKGLNVIQRLSASDVLPPLDNTKPQTSGQSSHLTNSQSSHLTNSQSQSSHGLVQNHTNNVHTTATQSTSQNCEPSKLNGEIPGTHRSHAVRGVNQSANVNDVANQSSSSYDSPAHHQRNLSNSSTVAIAPSDIVQLPSGFVVAFHRKMMRMDVYFLSSQKTRPSLFGTPLILPCADNSVHEELYRSVWTQVTRLVSPLPPNENNTQNHAQDCDDSLGYEYPFILKAVQEDGLTCAWCPWYRFCRGCKINCDSERFDNSCSYVAIDWEPTALHLRYQSAQEKVTEDHSSIAESREQQTEPINLHKCLQAFTRQEELGDDEQWYCSKCKKHQLAGKKLEIWKLPPILIIHLKRFQLLNSKWVKSQKIVKFPFRDFDPSDYLVSRNVEHLQTNPCSNATQLTCEMNGDVSHGDVNQMNGDVNQMNGDVKHVNQIIRDVNQIKGDVISLKSNCDKGNQGLATTNGPTVLNKSNGMSDEQGVANVSFELEDYTDVRYDLKSMACHTGILGGGHYVAYAQNPTDKWYQYNDSMCKEVSEDSIDTNSAYILFYERRDLDYSKYMPDIRGREPDISDIDDECDSDIKKMCSIQ